MDLEYGDQCVETYDQIRYIVVNSGYEANVFERYPTPSQVKDFCEKNRCRLSLVFVNNVFYIPDYNVDEWIINTHNQQQYDLVASYLQYYNNHKTNLENVEGNSCIVFEISCTHDGSLNNTFHLLAAFSYFEICRVWSCYHLEFNSLRAQHQAVIAFFDCEGG